MPLLVDPYTQTHVFSSQYTPKDSLVFGGNFLHSWNIATREQLAGHRSSEFELTSLLAAELRVRDLEIATKVPKKFRFPYFRRYVDCCQRTFSPSLNFHTADYAGMWQKKR